MATEIRVPTLGESVSEATVGTWFKKVGDAIKADEPILELETDKVTIEVPAPASGTLSEIVAQAGETVGLGALLGQIAEGAAAAAAPAAAAPAAAPAAPAPTPAAPAATAAAPAASVSSMPPAPAAAKMLAENNLSAEQVDGSGKRGQVLKGDVIAAVAKAAAAPAAAAPAAPVAARGPSTVEDAAREERVKMTRLRQTIAKRLKDAQNTAAMPFLSVALRKRAGII